MPYSPGVSYRGDQYIYQGITDAADGLARGITGLAENKKEEKEKEARIKGIEASGILDEYLPPGKTVSDMGYDATIAMMESLGVHAKIGRDVLAQKKMQHDLAAMETEQRDLAITSAESKRRISEGKFDPVAFGQSLLDKGLSPDRASSAVETFKTLVPWQGPSIKNVDGQTYYDPASGTPLKKATEKTEEFRGDIVKYKGGLLGIWDPKTETYKRQLPPSEGGGIGYDAEGRVTIKPGGRPIQWDEIPLLDDEGNPVGAMGGADTQVDTSSFFNDF